MSPATTQVQSLSRALFYCSFVRPGMVEHMSEYVPSSEDELLVELVAKERASQYAKWGPQSHDPLSWLAILMEEVGEVARAHLEHAWGSSVPAPQYIEELIQVAAVAQAVAADALAQRRAAGLPDPY